MDVRIQDTTFRDGAQSLWAMAIRHGMMEPVAGDMDNAGFAVIEVPANPAMGGGLNQLMMGRAEFIGGKVSTHLIDDVMPDFLSETAASQNAAQ
jgi:isopropylmalate/homocitrate/citramalate synthase